MIFTLFYYELERLAAQGEIISHDDTTVKILSVTKENKGKAERGEKGRKGTYTTSIVSQVGLYIIYLFVSGRRHSGENMANLLKSVSLGWRRSSGWRMR